MRDLLGFSAPRARARVRCETCGRYFERHGLSVHRARMHPGPSALHDRALAHIVAMVRIRGYPPSVRELAEHIGRSPSVTMRILRELQESGHIRRVPKSPRAVEVL